MDDAVFLKRLRYRVIFVLLCALFVFCRLLPLDTAASHPLGGADVMLALTFVWLLRRPDYVPIWLVTGVFLLADMLLSRAPGLWTCLVIVATEFLRGRSAQTRNMPLISEFCLIAVVTTSMYFAQWLIQAGFFLDQPSLWRQLAQVPMTLLSWPILVLISQTVLGIRRAPQRAGRITGMRV